jgi:hypothetical protein
VVREPVRKEKTRQVPAMEAPPDAEPTHGEGHFDGRKRDGRLAYIESVITILDSPPRALRL